MGLWVVAASGLLWGCGKSGGSNNNNGDAGQNPPKPGEDCSNETCPNQAPPTDWKGSAPTFAAHLQVVDPGGAPVAGATVRTDKLMWMTDAKGFARIGPIPATRPQPLTVEKAGFTPRHAQTTAFESGQQMTHVVLMPVGVRETIALHDRIRVGHEGASVDLPPKALIATDGTRPSSGKAEMTQLSPDKVSADAMPSSRTAWNEDGAPTVMEQLLSATYLHFTDDTGQDLRLAPGQTAVLEMPVPSGAAVAMGEEIPMWTLDEKDNTWRREKTCTIEARQIGGQTETVCRGVVSHFSIWAIAKEYDIYRPNALGCLNAKIKEEEGACYTTEVEREVLLSCDAQGANCKPVGSPYQGFYVANEATQVSYCSVVTPGTYRIELTYRVDSSKCPVPGMPLNGRRVLVSAPMGLQSFADMLGQSLMLNFSLNGTRDCPTLCAQVEFQIDKTALEAPAWTDADGDGAWVTAAKDATPPLGASIDCDDTDRLVRPGAPEPFCATKDMNCDGAAPKAIKSLTEVTPYWKWNNECSSCLALDSFKTLKTEEKDGNEYDEDCDGRVGDRDLDGLSAPRDCNDRDDRISPNLAEVPGNFADENCDGMTLDADNDGFPARAHAFAVTEISAQFPQFTADKFVDCDDYDRRTNPAIPVSQEVGQMSRFYYWQGENRHRHFSYCSLFQQDGTPSDYFFQVIKDRNCDGKLTDIDGDGFTHPNDHTLGRDKALDCDELDPRVGAGQWDPDRERTLICPNDPSKLVNDSICTVKVQPYEPGVTCPVLSLNGTTLKTVCEEIKNADGSSTGEGVCGFVGWSDANPLSIHPGEFFGPCDGDPGPETKLPCAEGLACGGPAEGPSPWTPEFEKYIRDTYLEGAELRFKGMCFPACIIR
jgi:hypothetical protein